MCSRHFHIDAFSRPEKDWMCSEPLTRHGVTADSTKKDRRDG